MMGGYIVASCLEASEDESDGFGSANDVDDDDDGSLSDDEISTWCTYLFVTHDKRGSSFEMRVVILIGGGLV